MQDHRQRFVLTRRGLMTRGAALGAGLVVAGHSYSAVSATARPRFTHGIQTGDVVGDRAVLWARADRAARLNIEWSTTSSFAEVHNLAPVDALPDSDFTAQVVAEGLPQGQQVYWRARWTALDDVNSVSNAVIGRFRTQPTAGKSVSFTWSGDTCGQGWGINPDMGGMTIYKTMNTLSPDFFINSGDCIYADGPIKAEVQLGDGSVYRNLTLEGKHKVAETLEEYRTAYRYNLMDDNMRGFLARVPMFSQWDDHETINNWYPNEILNDSRYKEKRVAVLARRAKQAFLEYNPTLPTTEAGQRRINRYIPYGPSLDVFFLDMRSFRGDNTSNLQTEEGPDTAFLGASQILWLKRALLASKATWKVIAADMPIGLNVGDGTAPDSKPQWEAIANGENGSAKGRELEIARLLKFIKDEDIKNVVWLTADVHYTAAHYYDPSKAQFTDFKPFWEFVSGPLNAGTFGPNTLDATFGPELKFVKAPPAGQANLPPTAGYQFFGHVEIDGKTEVMTVNLMDAAGAKLWSIDLTPEA